MHIEQQPMYQQHIQQEASASVSFISLEDKLLGVLEKTGGHPFLETVIETRRKAINSGIIPGAMVLRGENKTDREIQYLGVILGNPPEDESLKIEIARLRSEVIQRQRVVHEPNRKGHNKTSAERQLQETQRKLWEKIAKRIGIQAITPLIPVRLPIPQEQPYSSDSSGERDQIEDNSNPNDNASDRERSKKKHPAWVMGFLAIGLIGSLACGTTTPGEERLPSEQSYGCFTTIENNDPDLDLESSEAMRIIQDNGGCPSFPVYVTVFPEKASAERHSQVVPYVDSNNNITSVEVQLGTQLSPEPEPGTVSDPAHNIDDLNEVWIEEIYHVRQFRDYGPIQSDADYLDREIKAQQYVRENKNNYHLIVKKSQPIPSSTPMFQPTVGPAQLSSPPSQGEAQPTVEVTNPTPSPSPPTPIPQPTIDYSSCSPCSNGKVYSWICSNYDETQKCKCYSDGWACTP